jgi:hypothetical protein
MGGFNRGSNTPGRRRDLAKLPGESSGEGTTGNVIPRGTTNASVRRGQALLRIMNDRVQGAGSFNRGTRAGARRRNFSLMAELSAASTPTTGVQVVRGTFPSPAFSPVSWDSENYDFGGWWSFGSTLTCPTTGTYQIEYSLVATYVANDITLDIYVNGASVDSQVFSIGTSPVTRSTSVALVAGDTIQLQFIDGVLGTIREGTLTIT